MTRKERYAFIIAYFERNIPVAETELEFATQAKHMFHLSDEDLGEKGCLFKFFYTALPLHERLEEFCYQYKTCHAGSRRIV